MIWNARRRRFVSTVRFPVVRLAALGIALSLTDLLVLTSVDFGVDVVLPYTVLAGVTSGLLSTRWVRFAGDADATVRRLRSAVTAVGLFVFSTAFTPYRTCLLGGETDRLVRALVRVSVRWEWFRVGVSASGCSMEVDLGVVALGSVLAAVGMWHRST